MVSDDPDFETKAADIIGLYVKPRINAAVFCVREKQAIQALDSARSSVATLARKSRATRF
jgi:hypothetical protein